MDVREEQLRAAAGAMRAWVSAQRATWDQPYLVAALPAAQVASVPGALPGAAADAAGELAAADAPSVRRFDFGALERLAEIFKRPLPVSAPAVRVAAAATLVILSVGAARVYWPAWTRTIKSEVAAGRAVVAKGRNVVARSREAGRDVVETGRRVVGAAVGKTAPETASAASTGVVQIETDPVGAVVLIDGEERGVSPLTLRNLAPGTYSLLLQAGAGSVQRRIVVTAGETTTVTEGIFSGWLRVESPIEVLVSEGGRGLRLDDSGQVLLPPGRHDVLLENRSLGYRELRRIDVRPGDTTSITVELPVSLLSVTTSENAEVFVDGKLAGITPLTDYAVALGTREITVQADSGAVRRLTVRVTKEPMRLNVDLSAP